MCHKKGTKGKRREHTPLAEGWLYGTIIGTQQYIRMRSKGEGVKAISQFFHNIKNNFMKQIEIIFEVK